MENNSSILYSQELQDKMLPLFLKSLSQALIFFGYLEWKHNPSLPLEFLQGSLTLETKK